MAEQLKVQYTDPNTGNDALGIVRFDLTKYRDDDSLVPKEDIYFTATSTNVDTVRLIEDLAEASLVANPLNPYAHSVPCSKPGVVYGLCAAKSTSGVDNTITLTHNPTTLGFVVNEPIAVLSAFDGSVLAYITPNAVAAEGVSPYNLGFASNVPIDILENYIIVKLDVPRPYAPAWTKENKDWGAKAVLEKPGTPTIDATPASGSINVTITNPTTNHVVIHSYNVYVISDTNEGSWFDMAMPVIKGNRKPDAVLTKGDTTDKSVTTFGGGADAGGGNIVNGWYWVVCVAIDAANDMNVNTSYLSNIDYVQVTY
jgi:hypothetical protein